MTYAATCALVALVVAVLAGRPLVGGLRSAKLAKAFSGDEPEAYAGKAGTPTMGGLVFLVAIAAVGLFVAVDRDADLLLPLATMLAAAGLGALDDLQTLHGRARLGGHEPWVFFVKWGVLLAIGLAVALVLHLYLDLEDAVLPHFGAFSLGVVYVPVAIGVFVVATSGAVITDGMDGLMAGVSALAFAAYGVIALSQDQEALGALCLTVAGAAGGFLYYNAYPAQVFMGDLGAQALATGLVVVAFMTGWWLLLPVIGVVFFLEGASDALQIGYFKATGGRRLLRMAPVHYHLQLSGWQETQVVARLWLLGLAGAFGGVALAFVE